MPITLICRSPYGIPFGKWSGTYWKYTVLTLFQELWKIRRSEAPAFLKRGGSFCRRNLLQEIPILDGFFNEAFEQEIPIPESESELVNLLFNICDPKPHIIFNSDGLEIRTDDGEFALRYYFLNNNFIDRNIDKCAFFKHRGALPAGFIPQKLEPCTYLYVHAPTRLKNSQKWDKVFCPGVKLENFKAAVEAYSSLENIEATGILQELTELAATTNNWLDALKAIAYKARNAYSHIDNWTEGWSSEHIYQLHLDMNYRESAGEDSWDSQDRATFFQVIVFDEVWASTYPHIASSLQFYASDEKLINNE